MRTISDKKKKLSPEEQIINKRFYLKKKGRPYELIETTGTTEIKYTGYDGKPRGVFFKLNRTPSEVSIQTICAEVKRDCREYLKRNNLEKYELPPEMEQHRRDCDGWQTVIADRYSILAELEQGQILHEMDINRCYWDIMRFVLHFLSEKIHKKYIKHKDPRNRAMGNLNKRKYCTNYDGDGHAIGKPKVKVSPYRNFHHAIVIKMNMIYWEVIQALPQGCHVYYFKTDSFLVQPGRHIQNKVKMVLDKYNLTYKLKRYKILDLHCTHMVLQNLDTKEEKTVSF